MCSWQWWHEQALAEIVVEVVDVPMVVVVLRAIVVEVVVVVTIVVALVSGKLLHLLSQKPTLNDDRTVTRANIWCYATISALHGCSNSPLLAHITTPTDCC